MSFFDLFKRGTRTKAVAGIVDVILERVAMWEISLTLTMRRSANAPKVDLDGDGLPD